ncbi:(2Fe-2S)-binding protein [Actinacidiphila acidipaludis]|uniref:(2Fe-2S)-binding protein n=1 Tax=Actinacidiphila acidipaludis TaxID=2873382 RepID=A0ABS7Q2W9_9ACTN|nr:(2Fe-2S)-binding protein [Streptomyces acidipaludis]MBY8877491.1 (2Fe-2S)-binding protein [Streptomyces acidipaludis]
MSDDPTLDDGPASGEAGSGHAAPGDDQLAALGPFFAVERHDPADPPAGTWRPVSEIADDPAVLDERVAAVRQFLAAGSRAPVERIEVRVAASVAHLGLAARLSSPLLATAVLHGRVDPVTLADLRRQDTLGGAFPLSLPRPGSPGTTDVAGVLLDDLAAPLAAAFGRFGVSTHILRGNAASALAGAARVIAAAGGGGTITRGAEARTLVEELLRHPFLAGTGGYGNSGYGNGGGGYVSGFRRHSCCLIYRAAPDHNGALCGDCALSRPATSPR